MKKSGTRIISVKCSVTGVECFVNADALAQRLKKFGSIEGIEKNWVSRDGKQKKVSPGGFVVKPIRERGPDGRFIPRNK